MSPRGLRPDTSTNKATVISLAAKLPPPDTVQLTMALQTTLELDKMLTVFVDELQQVVEIEGVQLKDPRRGIDLLVGATGRHRCGYRLNLLGDDLGELLFSRDRPFGEPELANLEFLLAALLYPLRNALTYREALRAAFKDPLTGAGNRAAFDEALSREIQLAHRNELPLALLAIDLDHFKRINDQHGHIAGDCVLKAVVKRIHGAMRGSDQLFRYGGEEFVCLLTNTGAAGADVVAERIRQAVAGSMTQCAEQLLQITVSLGIAVLEPGEIGSALFAKADQALYQAKRTGRNRVERYRDGMQLQ